MDLFTYLPNNPYFRSMINPEYLDKCAVTDSTKPPAKQKHTYRQLLGDILCFRKVIWQGLSEKTRNQLRNDEDVYFGYLAPGGYEFTIVFFTIWALGACIVPLCISHPPAEIAGIIDTSTVTCVITLPKYEKLASDTANLVKNKNALQIFNTGSTSLTGNPFRGQVKANVNIKPERHALVIFTSGTTGPPKGCLYTHGKIESTTTNHVGTRLGWDITHNDVALHPLPVHHASGIIAAFMPYIFAGAEVEFIPATPFDPRLIWERWLKGGLTVFNGVPTMWTRLMRYYESDICKMPDDERLKYEKAAQSFRLLFSGGAAFPSPLKTKWNQILDNQSTIIERYGATEFRLCFCTSQYNDAPVGSVGRIVPGIEVRLSEGDKGEILIKSPWLFSGYLHNPEATQKAYTPDGFFKTGDLARREGEFYFMIGRASVDLKSGGYKLSALDIERALLSLDYIDEACVLGVDDEEWGQRVGAIVVLRNKPSLTINELREDLRPFLASYQMPSLLIIVGAIPKSHSGKMQKRVLGPQFFGDLTNSEIQKYGKSDMAGRARI